MFLEIGNIIKKYENNKIKNEELEEVKLYNINEIIELFPTLSKHIITNAINDNKLKVTWIGNKRFFYLKDIETYLQKSEIRVINDTTQKLQEWRNKK